MIVSFGNRLHFHSIKTLFLFLIVCPAVRSAEIPAGLKPGPNANPSTKLDELRKNKGDLGTYLQTAAGLRWLKEHAIVLGGDELELYRTKQEAAKFAKERQLVLDAIEKLHREDKFYEIAYKFIECMS